MIRILWVKRSLHARMLTPSKLLGATPAGVCIKVARAALLQQYLLHLLHLHLSLTSVTMSEWVVLDITSMTKTTKSDKVIKILKDVCIKYYHIYNLVPSANMACYDCCVNKVHNMQRFHQA